MNGFKSTRKANMCKGEGKAFVDLHRPNALFALPDSSNTSSVAAKIKQEILQNLSPFVYWLKLILGQKRGKILQGIPTEFWQLLSFPCTLKQ